MLHMPTSPSIPSNVAHADKPFHTLHVCRGLLAQSRLSVCAFKPTNLCDLRLLASGPRGCLRHHHLVQPCLALGEIKLVGVKAD